MRRRFQHSHTCDAYTAAASDLIDLRTSIQHHIRDAINAAEDAGDTGYALDYLLNLQENLLTEVGQAHSHCTDCQCEWETAHAV